MLTLLLHNNKRLDFARVCVEISANSDLPKVIQIKHGNASVTVHLEYQWLPPKCNVCKVFGHTCKPKPVPEPMATTNNEAWKIIGKALGGGGDALEAVTKLVPQDPGVQAKDRKDNGGIMNVQDIIDQSDGSSTAPHKPAAQGPKVPFHLGNSSKDLLTIATLEPKENRSPNLGGTIVGVDFKPHLDPDPKPPDTSTSTAMDKSKGVAATVEDSRSYSSKKKGGKKGRNSHSASSPSAKR